MSEHTPTGEGRLFLHGKPVDDFIENHEHVSPTSMYVKILGALFVLTALTYAVSFADLGPASLPVAMFVAFIKASLVCLYFMHLKYDDRYHVFVFLSTLLFVGIFFMFTMFDLASRDRLNEQQGTFFLNDYDKGGVVSEAKKRADEAMLKVMSEELPGEEAETVGAVPGGEGDMVPPQVGEVEGKAAGEAPAGGAPAGEAPAEGAPAGEAPAEGAPAGEAPAEEKAAPAEPQ